MAMMERTNPARGIIAPVEYVSGTATAKHVKFATLHTTESYLSLPVVFLLGRTNSSPCGVVLRFSETPSDANRTAAFFKYYGDDYGVRLVHSGENTWDLYAKLNGWNSFSVMAVYTSFPEKMLGIEFLRTQLEGDVPEGTLAAKGTIS